MLSEKLRAYISVSFSERLVLKGEIDAITKTLAQFNIQGFIFVDHYSFNSNQERDMMEQAMKDIEASDLLIAESSYKAIGVGVEVGYGKAKNKPIIYLRKKEAEHSTTVSGISDFQIIYQDISDLQSQLSKTVQRLQIKR